MKKRKFPMELLFLLFWLVIIGLMILVKMCIIK